MELLLPAGLWEFLEGSAKIPALPRATGPGRTQPEQGEIRAVWDAAPSARNSIPKYYGDEQKPQGFHWSVTEKDPSSCNGPGAEQEGRKRKKERK